MQISEFVSNRQKLVLAIEDDLPSVALMREILTSAGFRFHACTTGRDSFEAVPRLKPNLVLLDAQLPVTNGFEVCRKLRTTAAGARIPIIFLSNRRTPEETDQARAAGASDVIPKPVQRFRLLETVRRWNEPLLQALSA